MKKITITTFITAFLISCGSSTEPVPKDARSIWIEECFELTPGGSSYMELCACGYDRGLSSMTPEERRAFDRDYIEVTDLQYRFSVPLKFVEAYTSCTEEAL